MHGQRGSANIVNHELCLAPVTAMMKLSWGPFCSRYFNDLESEVASTFVCVNSNSQAVDYCKVPFSPIRGLSYPKVICIFGKDGAIVRPT
jgi:hypothetical protein